MLVGGSNPGPGATVFNAGGVGLRNIFKGSQTSCALNRCDSGNNVEENNGFSYGINIYRNPRFANTADLLRSLYPWLRHLFADGGYAGPKLAKRVATLGA